MRVLNIPTLYLSKGSAARAAEMALEDFDGEADRYIITRHAIRDDEGGNVTCWSVSFLDANNMFIDHLIEE